MDNLQLKNEKKEKIKLAFLTFIAIFIYAFALLYGAFNAYKDYENDLIEQNKQTQVVSNNNIDINISKNIDIKSLNQNTTNVIDLFNIENYFTGFLHFDQNENPTLYGAGDSVIIVGFSLNLRANIDYAFDEFYISSIDYVFTSKFSSSIPVDQLTQYEFDYAREEVSRGTFTLTYVPESINDLILVEDLWYCFFENNTYMQTSSLFDDNGIVFSNTFAFVSNDGTGHYETFSTSPVNGFYDTNNFFTNGFFLKIVHKPNFRIYVNGIYDLISSNYDKDYEIGYDKGYYDGKKDTLEDYPPIDKVNVAIKYVWSTISNAINSVLNVFNIEILPGIPLYTLIMIPVIISVLFFVLKVVKK